MTAPTTEGMSMIEPKRISVTDLASILDLADRAGVASCGGIRALVGHIAAIEAENVALSNPTSPTLLMASQAELERELVSRSAPEPVSAGTDPGLPAFATVRMAVEADGDNVHSIECRFADGQKFAAVHVEDVCEELAFFIRDTINSRQSGEWMKSDEVMAGFPHEPAAVATEGVSPPMPIMRWRLPNGAVDKKQPMPEPLPWAVIEPHRAQAMTNHGQTLERLRERQGLSACEAVAILEDRRWHRMDPAAAAFTRLAELVRSATS